MAVQVFYCIRAMWSALNALHLNSHPVVSEYCFIRRVIDRRADVWGNTAPGRETDREIHREPRNIVHQEQPASKQAYCALLKASSTPAQSAADTTDARREQKHTRVSKCMNVYIHTSMHTHVHSQPSEWHTLCRCEIKMWPRYKCRCSRR